MLSHDMPPAHGAAKAVIQHACLRVGRVLVALATAALAGCHGHVAPSPNAMADRSSAGTAPFPPDLVGAMCIGEVTSLTAKFPDIDPAAYVPAFRAAIDQTLAANGLRAPGSCRLRVDASIGLLSIVGYLHSYPIYGSVVTFRVADAADRTRFWTTIAENHDEPGSFSVYDIPTTDSETNLRNSISVFLARLRAARP